MKLIYTKRPYQLRFVKSKVILFYLVIFVDVMFLNFTGYSQNVYWLESINNKVRKVTATIPPVIAASGTNIASANVPLFLFIDTRNNFAYWSDNGTGTIKKVAVSGGAITDVVIKITGVGVYVEGIYIDVTNNILYWSETGIGAVDKIKKIDISGSLPKLASDGADIVTGIANVRGITVDTVANQIYFIDGGTLAQGKGIYRASLSAPPVTEAAATKIAATTIVGGVTPQPNTLVLDRINNFIYWSDYANPGGKIQRAPTNAGTYPATPTNIYTGESIRGISINPVLKFIYWIEPLNLKIKRASLETIPITIATDIVTDLSYFPRNLVINSSSNALPVSFILFNSVCTAGAVKLTWKTAQEFNSKLFAIEKSLDSRNWQVIGNLKAAGNSNSEQTYSFTDNSVKTNALYRVVEIDIDERKQFSSIIRSSCAAASELFTVYPNPVTDIAIINLNNNQPTLLKIELYDEKGALVKTGQINLPLGNNQIQLEMSSFAKGSYNLTARWGDNFRVTKVVKN